MSKPGQPYSLSRGKPIGDAVAKSFADVGTAISNAVSARSSVKKHQAGLAHLASEAELDRAHDIHTLSMHHEHEARMHQLGTESALQFMSSADSLGAKAHARGQLIDVNATPTSVNYSTSTGRVSKPSGASKAGGAVGKALGAAVAGAATKNPKAAALGAKVGEAVGAKAGELASKGAKAAVAAVKDKAAAKPKPAAPKKPAASKGAK